MRGSVALARRAHIPPLIVGLTVVAFGTSAPELCISISAVLQGQPDISIGNVVGSNIANVLLVLGVPALIYPTLCNQESVGRDIALVWKGHKRFHIASRLLLGNQLPVFVTVHHLGHAAAAAHSRCVAIQTRPQDG